MSINIIEHYHLSLLNLLNVFLILLIGYVLARVLRRQVGRLFEKLTSRNHQVLIQRLVFYGILFIACTTALQQLDIHLTALLGAAGILTVAIGFASQTSVANIISGIFLLGERPFSLGDVITVGSTTGEVLSIDALSVKLRTLDNTLVRIPNDTLIKTNIINLTHYPTRRYDCIVSIAYESNVTLAEEVLLDLANKNQYSLTEPSPQVRFKGFGDSSIDLQLCVWCERQFLIKLKLSLVKDILQHFAEANISIPYPHRRILQ